GGGHLEVPEEEKLEGKGEDGVAQGRGVEDAAKGGDLPMRGAVAARFFRLPPHERPPEPREKRSPREREPLGERHRRGVPPQGSFSPVGEFEPAVTSPGAPK